MVCVSVATSALRIRAAVVRFERDGLHGLSRTKSAGRFSRHATLNSLMKQTLESLDLPSMLEPRGLGSDVSSPAIGRQNFQPISATIMSPKCPVD